MTVSVLLVDNHKLVRNGLHILIESDAELQVVAESGYDLAMLDLVSALRPVVLCLDVSAPHFEGIEATRLILRRHAEVKVVGLFSLVERRYVVDLMGAGAVGYVAKYSTGDDLRKAVHAVADGGTFLCPIILAMLTDSMRSRLEQKLIPLPQLGTREQEVLQLIAEGLTSTQIAGRMGIASATVDVHRRNIMHKLDLHGIAELTRYAMRNGLIPFRL